MSIYATLLAEQAARRQEVLDKQRAERDWLARVHKAARLRAIDQALRAAGGNRQQAADALGCDVQTVYRHVRAFGLPAREKPRLAPGLSLFVRLVGIMDRAKRGFPLGPVSRRLASGNVRQLVRRHL